MSRKKEERRSGRAAKEPIVKEETKHGILAIILFALALFFILARLGYAGLAGRTTYDVLGRLFGIGFLFIPLTLFILGLSFLRSVRPNFMWGRVLSGLILFLASLGLIDLLRQKAGGILGSGLTKPLIGLFQVYMTAVFLAAVWLITLLVIFDITPTAFWSWLKQRKNKSPTLPLEEEEVELVVETTTNPSVDLEEKAKAGTTKKEEPVARAAEAKDDEGMFGKIVGWGKRPADAQFTPPPLSLLETDSGKPGTGDIKANANIIKRTLANFGITVEMDEVSIGPSITRYALKPAEGVKLARIVGLHNDLALALAAHPIRIEAPIPGKSLVGIEIPNSVKSMVGLASLLSAKEFVASPLSLLVSLGRGISGLAHFANLAKAPHLLIAGATGSGKSVAIHTIITSLLYRNPPDQLRFIMIDPKRVELTLYNRVPHLLTPVITDAKKAIMALRWAAKEMDRRYDLLEQESARDIESYYKKMADSSTSTTTEGAAEREKMPYLVIIIDELADIMSAYPRELEAAIVRLAQMSRAVGIHLIISTQRPSVEVITGLIKANIPSRIALQVASQIDSRTILDMAGAEKLLGSGDMLYLSGDMAKPIRLQSAFISEEEVKRVAKYLADNYEEELGGDLALTVEAGNNALASGSITDDEGGADDELYEAAREAVIEAGKASASYLQRKLKVGYARAARLLDMLEERKVIGPGEGAKPREVYGAAPTTAGETEMFE